MVEGRRLRSTVAVVEVVEGRRLWSGAAACPDCSCSKASMRRTVAVVEGRRLRRTVAVVEVVDGRRLWSGSSRT